MSANAKLVLGAGEIDRTIDNADDLLLDYRKDTGYAYLRYRPITPATKLFPEDLAVTLLVNSRVGYRAFQSLQEYAETINLETLPQKPLEQISNDELKAIAEIIATVANWPGFAVSVTTKVLHKKRPDLIPLLDNQAIFGAYMNLKWPEQPSSQESIKSRDQIEQALSWIRFDLLRDENKKVWPILKVIEPTHSLIQIFDGVWWTYFRSKEKPGKAATQSGIREVREWKKKVALFTKEMTPEEIVKYFQEWWKDKYKMKPMVKFGK